MSNLITGALRMVFPRYPSRRYLVGRLGDERDYQWFVGNGSESPLVDACLSFIIGGFTQMLPVVVRSEPNEIDSTEVLAAHEAAVLFRRPTFDPDLGRSWFSWMTMIAGVLVSYCVDGNAYLLKIRSGAGIVVQLWYAPNFMLEPRWDPQDPRRFITGYDYAPDGTNLTEGPTSIASADGRGPVYFLRPQDVIHLRDGIDPQNIRKGRSKVKKVLREIYTDEEAARWTASLLRNQGVPGLIISPDSDKYTVDKNDAAEVKDRLRADFSGDRRGEPIVMRGKTKVEQYGFNPEQMKLREIRALPEERIAASLGVAASVVGFGAGLEGVKVGRTLAEHVDLSWQNGILSRARPLAAELTEQYLSEFELGAAVTHDFAFDTSRVPIMADYHKAQAERHEILVQASIEDRGEARRALGLRPGQRDRVLILQSGNVEVPSDKDITAVPAITAPGSAPRLPARTETGSDAGDEDNGDLAGKMIAAFDRVTESNRALAHASLEGSRELATAMATKAATPTAPSAVHVHFDEGSIKVDAPTTIAKGAIQHTTKLEAGAIQVDAKTSVEPGAVKVEAGAIQHTTQIDNAGDMDFVRDAAGRVAGTRKI